MGWLDDIGNAAEGYLKGAAKDVTDAYSGIASHVGQAVNDVENGASALGQGNILGAVGDAAKTFGNFAGAAFDLGTLPIKESITAFSGFGSLDRAAYSDLISRPLTTVQLAWNRAAWDANVGDLVNGDKWRTAWNESQSVSPGQAFEGGPDSPLNTTNMLFGPAVYLRDLGMMAAGVKNTGTPDFVFKSPGMVNPEDGARGYQALAQNDKFATGSIDFVTNMELDPGKLLGPAAKVSRGLKVAGQVGALADRAPTAEKALGIADNSTAPLSIAPSNVSAYQKLLAAQKQSGSLMAKAQQGTVVKALADMNKYREDPTKLTSLSWMRANGVPTAKIAGLIMNSTPETDPLVLRTLLGDTSALNALRAKRVDLAQQVVDIQSKRDIALQAALEGNSVPSDVAVKLSHIGALPGSPAGWKVALQQAAGKGYDNLPANLKDVLHEATPALNEHIADQQKTLDELNRQNGWLGGVIDNANALTQRGVSGGITARARQPILQGIRSAQMKGLADYGKLRDHPVLYSFWHKPLTLVTSAADLVVPHILNFNDDRSWEQVRSNLMDVRSLTAEEKNNFLGQYLKATTPAQRAETWNKIELYTSNAIAGRIKGLSAEDTQAAINEFRTQKGIEAANRERIRYSHEANAGVGTAADLIDLDGKGNLAHAPLFSSQLSNSTNVLNLRQFEKYMNTYGETLGRMRRGVGSTAEWLHAASSSLQNGMWKTSLLSRPASGIRAVMDESARTLGHIGALAFSKMGAAGVDNMVKNFLYSRGLLDITDVPGMERIEADLAHADQNLKQVYAWQDEERARGLQPGTLVNPDTIAQAEAEHRTLQAAQANGQIFRSLPPVKGAKPFKLGRGQVRIGNHIGNGAFAGAGAIMEKVTGTDKMWSRNLHEIDSNIYSLFAKRALKSPTEFRTVLPGEDAHAALWADIVNKQFLNDPLARQIIFNDISKQQAMSWLRTPEGLDYVASMPRFQAHREDAVDAMYNDIAHVLLPGNALDSVNAEGRLTQDAINKIPVDERPPLTASALLPNEHNKEWWRAIKNITDKSFSVLMEKPVQQLAYHPAFHALYNGHYADILDAHAGEMVSVRDQLQYEEMARRRALIDLKRIHYDSAYRSNLADHLNFLMPFFAPYQSQLAGWMHVIADNPSAATGLYRAWNAPDKAFPVIDQRTGQPADSTTPDGEKAIQFQLPASLAKVLGLGDTTRMTIPKTMLSPVILSGGNGPLISPGLGPIASLSLSKIVGDNPQLANSKFVNALLPMGTSTDPTKAMLPGWGQTALDALNTNSQKYAQTSLADYIQQEYEYKSGRRLDAPSWSEANTKARFMLVMDAFAKFVSPVNAMPQSKWQFYADQAKVMEAADAQRRTQVAQQMAGMSPFTPQYEMLKEQLQSGWQAQFMQKYGPSAFVYTTSLMQNTSGIPATLQGVAESKAFGALLAKYPDLGGLLVHPTSGSFDQSAYQYEVSNGMRTQLTPQQAVTQNNVELGWAQYGMLRTYLDSQAIQMGYQTATQVPQFKQTLQNFTSQTTDQKSQFYNPDWYNNFESYSTTKVYGQIAQMTDLFSSNPNLGTDPQRPDLMATMKYLEYREQIRALMQQEGAKSIMTSGYQPQWDAFVTNLSSQYPAFTYVYNRYFAKDKLEG